MFKISIYIGMKKKSSYEKFNALKKRRIHLTGKMKVIKIGIKISCPLNTGSLSTQQDWKKNEEKNSNQIVKCQWEVHSTDLKIYR